MNSRFAEVYPWISPVCLGVVGLMIYGGWGALESTPAGWFAAVYWGVCGAFAATSIIFSISGLLAAKRHLRVARARLQRHRRDVSVADPARRRGSFGS